MLQKPGKKSKNSDHIRYLSQRLALWSNGDFAALLSEGRAIQKRLTHVQRKPEQVEKVFT